MATLSVWKFDSADGALDGLPMLKRLQEQQLVQVQDATLVSWPPHDKKPSIMPGVTNIAVRAGSAVALGVVNPLLALLPLIDFGTGKDADCRALAAEAETAATAKPPEKPAGQKRSPLPLRRFTGPSTA